MTETELLLKIDSGKSLTEEEIRNLIYDYEIECIPGEHGRWTQTIESICKLNNRYFSVYWEQGLTEYQEDEFYEQPVEVQLTEYPKVITVREWNPINKN